MALEGGTAHQLATAFLRSGTSTIAGFVFRAISVKILALLTGPSGIAAFGLIRQLIDFGIAAATTGNASAVVQGISSRTDRARDTYIRTSAMIFGAVALFIAGMFMILGPSILVRVAPDAVPLLVPMLPWIAIAILVSAAGIYVSAVVNGQKQYAEIVAGGALGGLALALSAWPVAHAALGGDFIAFAIAQTLPPLIIIVLALRPLSPLRWLPGLWRAPHAGLDLRAARELLVLSAWLGISSLIATLGITALRLMMLRDGGFIALGLFTAAYQIAFSMLALMGAPLQMFHLPALSESGEPEARRVLLREILSFSRLVAASYAVAVIAAKPLLLRLLYSSDFLPALRFLDWFLPALYFQSLYMVMGSAMAAQRLGAAACAVEALRTGVFVTIAAVAIFIAHDPYLLGPAYFISRVVAYVVALAVVRRAYGGHFAAEMSFTIRGALIAAAIAAVGIVALDRSSIDGPILVAAAAALGAIFAAATPSERRVVLRVIARR
jgi:O-antigen/teichoic acid export membrane protein